MGPVTLIFDLFDLETDTRVVSKVENLPSNWGTLGLWVLELFAMYTTRRTDRQTDGRTKATLIAPLSVAVSSPISDDRGDTCLSPGFH